MPSNSPRKFAPEPIEQSTKSSRHRESDKDGQNNQALIPEPSETINKSPKNAPQALEQKSNVRRFPVEAVETVTKSSKSGVAKASGDGSSTKPRRFAPQLIEETHKSSSKDKTERPHIRFKPEPVSVVYGGNRKQNQHDTEERAKPANEPEGKPSRRFTPVLVDTAKRSRKAGDQATLTHADRTEDSDQHLVQEHRKYSGSWSSTADRVGIAGDTRPPSHSIPPPEARRQLCAPDGSAPARLPPARNHSFRLPDLDTIESSESERDDSQPSSAASTPAAGVSPITASDSSYELHKHATRVRESVDESFAHYLLSLERKKAQQRLEEQALAAFPNADFGYEPPHHYVNNDDDSDDLEIEDRPVTFDFDDDLTDIAKRRDSTHNMYGSQHAADLQHEHEASKATDRQPSESYWWKPGVPAEPVRPANEFTSMRDRARPPMLGADLVFPRCPSPDPALFDVTQSSSTTRKRMLDAEQHARSRNPSEEGARLWRVATPQSNAATNPVVQKASGDEQSDHKGLWGGYCVTDDASATKGNLSVPMRPTGLMTPRFEHPNPFEHPSALSLSTAIEAPPTPPVSINDSDLGRIDSVLVTERELDELMEKEFPDSFITQVFNYLSLGYPSLARPYDAELAKISRIPVAELRADDARAKATPRGYIRLGPDFEGDGGDRLTEDSCMRWQALKVYVKEWCRQEQNMVQTESSSMNFGTVPRRGSWGL